MASNSSSPPSSSSSTLSTASCQPSSSSSSSSSSVSSSSSYSSSSSPSSLSPDIESCHSKAVSCGSEFYTDPASGYLVFTELSHRRRGYCCGSKCRHCPFGHFNVPSRNTVNTPPPILQPTLLKPAKLARQAKRRKQVAWVDVLFWSGGKDSYLALITILIERLKKKKEANALKLIQKESRDAAKPAGAAADSASSSLATSLSSLRPFAQVWSDLVSQSPEIGSYSFPAEFLHSSPLSSSSSAYSDSDSDSDSNEIHLFDSSNIVLLTTFCPSSSIVPHQNIHISALMEQARWLQLPLFLVPIPSGCPNTEYIQRLHNALNYLGEETKALPRLVFGDLHLRDLLDWRVANLSRLPLQSLAADGKMKAAGEEMAVPLCFPLFGRGYTQLLELLFSMVLPPSSPPALLAAGVTVENLDDFGYAKIEVSAVNDSVVHEKAKGLVKVGDRFDADLVKRLEELKVDVMGECGEFHSVVKFPSKLR